MIHLLNILLASTAFAGEGEGHTHGPMEHLGPVGIVLFILVVAGMIFHIMTKKK